MQILSDGAGPGGHLEDAHIVLLFGLGMIGSAVRDALLGSEYAPLAGVPLDWRDSAQRAGAFDAIRSALCEPPKRLSVAWNAGAANFFSSEDDVRRENAAFEETLGFFTKLTGELQPKSADFHYTSSAGGLFEGQRVVTAASRPAPLRPYGRMKLAQEQLLQVSVQGHEIAIYRPSSVYGPKAGTRAHGLINNLVENARNRRVTVLDARVMALRDYVSAGDIGNFIGRRIRFGGAGPVNFLVSARCASIFEVVRKIERILNLHVPFRYDENFGNSASITFSDSVLPPGWRPSTLDVGIRQFMVAELPATWH